MAITKYTLRNPGFTAWRDLEDVSNRLHRFFDDRPSTGTVPGSWVPPVNVSETKDGLTLTAELPGLSADEVSIDLDNNVLTIAGEKVEERQEGDDDRKYHVWERSYGAFSRSFTLPTTVTAADITATFDHGVLRVHLPKAPEAKGRKIEISQN